MSDPENRLGRRLAAVRTKRDISSRELARRLKTNSSNVSRMESGAITPSYEYVRESCAALGVLESGTNALLAYAALTLESFLPWTPIGDHPFASAVELVHALELQSNSIRSFQLTMVPELLRTDDYAEEIERLHPVRRLASKSAREKNTRGSSKDRVRVLDRQQRTHEFLIYQPALVNPASSDSAMRNQLQHLWDVSSRRGTVIGVIPQNTYWVDCFPVHAFEVVDDLVLIETLGGYFIPPTSAETENYLSLFSYLHETAAFNEGLKRILDSYMHQKSGAPTSEAAARLNVDAASKPMDRLVPPMSGRFHT